MDNANSRYMITAFDTSLETDVIWANCGKGLTKEEAISLYNGLKNYTDLLKLTVSKILTVKETTIYTFDNE